VPTPPLPPPPPQVRAIMATLCEVLSTPSEPVQRAVSNCLPPLVAALGGDKAYIEGLLDQLLATLQKGANYGERCGG